MIDRHRPGRWMSWMVCLSLLLLLPSLQARTVLDLDAALQPVQLHDWGDIFIDQSGALTPAELLSQERLWIPSDQLPKQRLSGKQVLWLRFIVPPAPDWERWYLEMATPRIKQASLFTQGSTGDWLVQHAGSTVPVHKRPIPHRHTVLPLQITAEEPRRYLLRVEATDGYLDAPVQFVSEKYLAAADQRESLRLGVYLGLCGLAVFMGVVCARWWRDWTPAVAAGAILSVGLYQVAASGLAGLQSWPGLRWLNGAASDMLLVVATAANMAMLGHICALRERSANASRLLHVVCLSSIPIAIAGAAAEQGEVAAGYIVVILALGMGAAAWAALRGSRVAGPAAVATLPVATALGLAGGQSAGWLAMPASAVAMMVQLASALHWPALLVLLMHRNQQRWETSRRLRGLERMDPSTGLINRFEFTERLVRMMARSQRMRYRSFVLVLEITNLEQLKRAFERHRADEMPVRVAHRLAEITRDIDSVARLDEHRFGILVEGPISAPEAASIGPRAVARCLIPFEGKPQDWLPHVRVAQALVPHQDCAATMVIDELETLLSAVPPDSRRAVFTLAER